MVLLQSVKMLLCLLLSVTAVIKAEPANLALTAITKNELPKNKSEFVQHTSDVSSWLEKASKEFINEVRTLTNPAEISKVDISVIARFGLNTSTLLTFAETTKMIVEKAAFPEANSCVDNVSQTLMRSASDAAASVGAIAVLGRYLKNDKSFRMVKAQNETARQACVSVFNTTKALIDGVSACSSQGPKGFPLLRPLPAWKFPLNRLCVAFVHQLQYSRFVILPLCRMLLPESIPGFSIEYSSILAAAAENMFVDQGEVIGSIATTLHPQTTTYKAAVTTTTAISHTSAVGSTQSPIHMVEVIPISSCDKIPIPSTSDNRFPSSQAIEEVVEAVKSGFTGREANAFSQAVAEKLDDMFRGLEWRIVLTRAQYSVHPADRINKYNAYHYCNNFGDGDQYGSYNVAIPFDDDNDAAWLFVSWLHSPHELVICNARNGRTLSRDNVVASNDKYFGEIFGDGNISVTALCDDVISWTQALCKTTKRISSISILIEESMDYTAVALTSHFGVISVNDHSAVPKRRITILGGFKSTFGSQIGRPSAVRVEISSAEQGQWCTQLRQASVIRDRSAWELVLSNAMGMLYRCYDLSNTTTAKNKTLPSTGEDRRRTVPEIFDMCIRLAKSVESFGNAVAIEISQFSKLSETASNSHSLDALKNLPANPFAEAAAVMNGNLRTTFDQIWSATDGLKHVADTSHKRTLLFESTTAFNVSFQRFVGFQQRLTSASARQEIQTSEGVTAYMVASRTSGKLLTALSTLVATHTHNHSAFSNLANNLLLCSNGEIFPCIDFFNETKPQRIYKIAKSLLDRMMRDSAFAATKNLLDDLEAQRFIESLRSRARTTNFTVHSSHLKTPASKPCSTDVSSEHYTRSQAITSSAGPDIADMLRQASGILEYVSRSIATFNTATAILRPGPELHMGWLFVSTVGHVMLSEDKENDLLVELRKVCTAAFSGFLKLHQKVDIIATKPATILSATADAIDIIKITPVSELDNLVGSSASIGARTIWSMSTISVEASKSLDDTLANLSSVTNKAKSVLGDSDFTSPFVARMNAEQFHEQIENITSFHKAIQISCIKYIMRLPHQFADIGLECMHTAGFITLSLVDWYYVNRCTPESEPSDRILQTKMSRILLGDLRGILSQLLQLDGTPGVDESSKNIIVALNKTAQMFHKNVQLLQASQVFAEMYGLAERMAELLRPEGLGQAWVAKALDLMIANISKVETTIASRMPALAQPKFTEPGSNKTISSERARAQRYSSSRSSFADIEQCLKDLYSDEVKKIKNQLAATLSSGAAPHELENSIECAQQSLRMISGYMRYTGEFLSRLSAVFNASTALEANVITKAQSAIDSKSVKLNAAWIERYKASLTETMLTFSEIAQMLGNFIRHFMKTLNARDISITAHGELPAVRAKTNKHEHSSKATELQNVIEKSNLEAMKTAYEDFRTDITEKLKQVELMIGTTDSP